MEKKVMVRLCAKIVAETEDRKIVGAIINVGCGGCHALYFMVENIGYEWYNRNVKNMDKSAIYRKGEQKMQVVPTLNFGGNCREAIHIYEKAFHGKISCLITYGEANDPEYNPLLKENQKEYIYHSELVLNNQRIIMSDHVDIEFQTCYSNFLTIMFDTKEEVQQAYEIMKEESKTIYPLEATPYSSCRVVFVDKFGIRWGIMTEQTER